jgi:hypothetical protein
MVGLPKIFTLDVTIRVLRLVYLKLKMGTALEATPRLHGHRCLLLSILAIVTLCFLTYLVGYTSLTKEKQKIQYGAVNTTDHILLEETQKS